MPRGALRRAAASLVALACVLASATPARATIVERVVAVIGERAILLSDLSNRARPYIVQIHQRVPKGAKRAAQMSQMYKALLEKMVDEELMRRAANRARLSVTAREIDDSIAKVARQARLTPERLVEEALKTGLTEREYRQEMRRQVLEAKLLNLRVIGRIRITEENLRSAYRQIVLEERRRLRFRAAWIKIRAPKGKAGKDRRTLAERVAASAQKSGDFASLARRFSDDTRTKSAGGLLGQLRPGTLPRQVDRVAIGLEIGQVSSPIRVGESLIILKLLEREASELPEFEEARVELQQRVYVDKMSRARRHWLDGLRKRTHVDIRL